MKREDGGAVAGGVVGTGAGLTGGTALVSASGTTVGLSGPGIMTGLAAIGGTAVGGIAVIAIGTVILASAGAYGGYRFAKWMGARQARSRP